MHPGFISDFIITKKNSMWLAGTEEQKWFVEVAANFGITPISIHIQRFTGHVYDWSILNDWPIQ